MTDQPDLFGNVTAESELQPGQGICPLCHRPQTWRKQLQEWSRYCGPQSCRSNTRICQSCGDQFQVGINGGGTKYCSAQCRYDQNFGSYKRNYTSVTCAWCDGPASYKTQKPQGEYVCQRCIEPIHRVWVRLNKHRVPIESRRRLLTDPGCDICGVDIINPTKISGDSRASARLVVDHDHGCCPGAVSCGSCVRGFLCGNCNGMLGFATDSTEALEQGAAYLRSYRTKLILRKDDHESRGS